MKSSKLAALLTTVALLTFTCASWAAEEGSALYKAKCAMCHKADASGNPAVKAPAIKGKSSEEVVKTIDTNPKHASLKKNLTADQIKAIGDYVASLK
jgi:mono/diheme cytochrome c family protein